MESEAHIGHDNVVNIGKESAGGVISVFSGPESVESSDPADEATLLCKLLVDEGGNGTQGHEPGSLNDVHLLE